MPTPYSLTAAHYQTDVTVAGVLATLRQRKLVIVWTTLALVLAVLIYCVFATPRYSATAVVEVQKSSSDLLDLGSLMATQQGEMGDAMNASLDLQTQVEILQSDTLALQVIDDLELEKSRDFIPHWSPVGAVLGLFSPKGQSDPVSSPLEDAPRRRTHATSTFKSLLKVKPIVGTRLIEVTFKDSDPKLAAAVVNDLTRRLVNYGFTERNQQTNETSQFLSGQLTDLKKEAQNLQEKVVALQRSTGIYSLGEDSQGRDQVYSATLDQLQQATTALSAATSSRIVKEALYHVVQNGDPDAISSLAGANLGTSGSSVQDSLQLLQNLRSQESTAAAQLAQDTSKFGPDYPRLSDERANIASVQTGIIQELARIGKRAKSDFLAARDTENNLQSVYNERKAQAEKLNDRAIEYGIAKQEADNSRDLYEDLSKRLGEAGVIEGLRSSNITVVSAGKVAAKPTSPNPPLYLLAAVLLGIFAGICAALYVDMSDPTIQSFAELEDSLGVPLLAVLPSFARKNLQSLLPFSKRRLLTIRGGSTIEKPVVLDKPGNSFAEAMRAMRLSILSLRGAGNSQVILVTSSLPGEGKTTVAANLAVVLEQMGKKVLFVEADMRNANSASSFDPSLNSVTGFSELLSDPESKMEANPVANVGGLQVLPSGPAAPYAADLLSTARMKELLDRWKLEFDHIVIDGTPLMQVSDSFILAQFADTAILVSRYGFTPKKSIERAYRKLKSMTNSRISVVLNAADQKSVNYSDYFGYQGSIVRENS
jgi:succinoglycan biosynthesis transport protein ExoP